MTRKSRTIAGAAAATIVAVSLALTGCSGNGASTKSHSTSDAGSSSSSQAKYDPKQKVTLNVTWWGADSRTAIMTKVFSAFEAKYPNITVTAQPVGSPDDEFNRLATDFAAGTAPDVFALGGSKPQDYGSQGALLDLSTVSKYLPYEKDYPKFSLANGTVNGVQYALPTGGNAVGMLINKDIWADAGVDVPTGTITWAQLDKDAAKISAAEKSKGIVGLDLRVQDILGTYAAQENNVGLYGSDGKVAVKSSVIKKWYDQEKAMVKDGALPDPSVIAQNWNVTPDRTLFGTGKAAITFGYSNQISAYTQGLKGANVALIAPPTDTKNSGVSVLPSQFWAIAGQSKHPAQAALLVNYMLNDPDAAKLILADRGLQFNDKVLKVVQPLLDPNNAQGATYLENVLKVGVVAPIQPAGAENETQLAQRTESDILFNKTSSSDGADSFVSELSQDLASAQ
ncbi:ABC transporter substrate-binding protein [Gryllotalpicola protaetiae]|uniref:Extracellular solute-binding protein n=1 Tax=Gryllotalpicola protaetiae TaxID=2419771 RepID=A0A387BF16_9MICO|nr:extracellular solute-binding protein [Gryllotalpicola protaetiae]AYG02503.1 extracellular solute-binding protein [Gryllotalpicola protaetiae]